MLSMLLNEQLDSFLWDGDSSHGVVGLGAGNLNFSALCPHRLLGHRQGLFLRVEVAP